MKDVDFFRQAIALLHGRHVYEPTLYSYGIYHGEVAAARQYLLHADPLGRFSIVSFVWGPGQTTPVHDHMVWGVIGMLRGAEIGQRFAAHGDGPMIAGPEETLQQGDIEVVSPTLGDVHKVSNALADRASISIHVYGANIGAVSRHVFDPATGTPKEFISGYSNAAVPNLWDLSGS